MVAKLIVHPGEPLHGSVPLPGDQPIALSRVALASLSRGRTTLAFAGMQRSLRVLLDALPLFGVGVEETPGALTIIGTGLSGFTAPERALDVRGEPEVAGRLLGLTVGREFPCELWVDQIVADLLVGPLSQVYEIAVEALEDGGVRLSVAPSADRKPGVEVLCHGLFSWVKDAVFLAGLRASSATSVEEKLATADHLERAMLRSRMPFEGDGTISQLHPPRDSDAAAPQIYEPVGSMELAPAVLGAAALVPQSLVTLREVCLNPLRADMLTFLRLAGQETGITPAGDRQGEPFGEISLRQSPIRTVELGGESVIRLGEGALFAMAVAARADGTSRFTDIVPRDGDPRRLQRVIGLLRSAGVAVSEEGGTVSINGSSGALRPLVTTTGGDPVLALLASILALAASGPSQIDDVECLRLGFPRWVGVMRALGAKMEIQEV